MSSNIFSKVLHEETATGEGGEAEVGVKSGAATCTDEIARVRSGRAFVGSGGWLKIEELRRVAVAAEEREKNQSNSGHIAAGPASAQTPTPTTAMMATTNTTTSEMEPPVSQCFDSDLPPPHRSMAAEDTCLQQGRRSEPAGVSLSSSKIDLKYMAAAEDDDDARAHACMHARFACKSLSGHHRSSYEKIKVFELLSSEEEHMTHMLPPMQTHELFPCEEASNASAIN